MSTNILTNLSTTVSKNKTLLLTSALLLIPTVVFADGGQSSGIDAILRSSTLEGNDSFRGNIAGYLHKPVSFVITIAGFMMIMFTFLKMALTLLYLSFPDLFDKIDAQQSQMLSGGLRGKKNPVDIISYFFALIFPNVKALTDYADEKGGEMDKTPLDYLKKQIPKIFLLIVLGAALYDGQFRNIIAKGADVALMFGNIFERHDTVGAVADFVGASEKYVFTYDTSTQKGKNQEKIAKAVQQHLHGLNPNIKSAEHATAVGEVAEDITKKVVEKMEATAKKGGMKDLNTIISFKISVLGKTVALRTASEGATNDRTVQYTLNPSDKEDKIVLDISPQKYVVVQFSELRDKDNRNWLWSTDAEVKGDKAE